METKKEKKKIDDNLIYIGNKPYNTYAWALLTQISNEKFEETIIVARGRFISKAVEVVELAKEKLSNIGGNFKIKNIEIGSEKLDEKNGGGKRNVSMIKITLSKK